MSKVLNTAALLCAVAACVPFLAGAQPADSQAISNADVVFGSSLVLSGPSEIIGREAEAGARAYFDRINVAGGIGGHKLRLVTLDDHYEPNLAVENTHKLIKEHHILAAINYVGTPTTLAALPVLSAAEVPLVGAVTGAKGLREPFDKTPANRYMFNTRASYADEGTPLAKQLALYGKVALFVQDDGYGQAVREAVTQGLAKYGLEPVVITTIKRNVSGAELKLAVEQAADAIAKSGAAAVAVGSVYAPVAALNEAMHARGKPTVIASVSFINTTGVLQTMKKSAAGMGIAQDYPTPYFETTKMVREFRADIAAWHESLLRQARSAPNKAAADELLIQAKYAVASYGTEESWVNARMAAEGLRRMRGPLTSENLRVALESIGKFDLGDFTVTFTPDSHRGSTWTELSVVSSDGTKILQ